MARDRVMIEVAVDLDPVPGRFHTEQDARDCVQAILLQSIPHYNPVVFRD